MDTNDILITGATGFIGGELLAARSGPGVRVVVRDAARLGTDDDVEVVEGDLDDDDTLRHALDGRACAYYLVHSMDPGSGDDFAGKDRELAERFVAAAADAGVDRIVYLGGVDPGGDTSEHLSSRREVEDVLGGGSPDLVALRASMIVGAQSDSFRTLAQIVQRLPVLALPTWRTSRLQPVAVADVVSALIAATRVPPGAYDIAGPDELSIEEMIEVIGELGDGPRRTFPIAISSSKLEGAAAAAVTDSDRTVLEPLMEGLHEDLVVADNALEPVFGVTPTPFREAAREALDRLREPERTPA